MDGDTGLVRRGEAVEYDAVEAADGLSKGVLLGPETTPTLSVRRFTLAPGGSVPAHTNDIEHEQYVLAGEYVVGIGDKEWTVRAGDAIHVPAGAVHWYRNESDEPGAFICAVPNGDDTIELVDE
ncbi:cupin domain-containing protein [Halosegnis sp.]|uniref:cupin domain-containing protein n=1 Tax=Halosegnis sp. TaxID=2864959 RepID=UPI0035D4EE63